MQEVIKFKLRANSTIIKKPESNDIYYTYNFPHKIMLLGLLGSIIGLNGYNYNAFCGKTDELPEYYEALKHFKLAVVPNLEGSSFSKKIQSFNNSVGYASKEKGNNLIVKEQWLENPSWYIYVLSNDSNEYKKLKEYLINKKCEYIPYIGKNDHFADISDVQVIQCSLEEEYKKIDSIYKSSIAIGSSSFPNIVAFEHNNIQDFEYQEVLPTVLSSKIGYKDFQKFVFTNKELEIKESTDIYKVNDQNIYFF